jgi:hypothetical protein
VHRSQKEKSRKKNKNNRKETKEVILKALREWSIYRGLL